MPDDSEGAYEVLDLLFQFRDKETLIRYVLENDIVLDSLENRALLSKFLQYNLNVQARFKDPAETVAGSIKIKGWKTLPPTGKIEKNPAKLIRAKNEITFAEAYGELKEQQGSMYAVYVPLIHDTSQIQRLLKKDGYVLTGFIPGRTRNGITAPMQGMWSKLRTRRPLVK
jgi:hypothetical protein